MRRSRPAVRGTRPGAARPQTAAGVYDGSGREFWLRKAALLDRIALSDEADGITSDAADLATRAAQRLMDLDDTDATCDPRHYVRQQYAHWAKHQ
ncbi:hypothetical protein [Streptomyces sp. NPDC005336]|uniref:hypothetical protein n=1 Tax=Streptomyces sp. NPDC005336 TaxID=3157035 RepID=UPI0033AFB3F7